MNKQLTTETPKTHVLVLNDGGCINVTEKHADAIMQILVADTKKTHVRLDGRLIAIKTINRVETYGEYEESQKKAGKTLCVKGHWHWVDDKNICTADRSSMSFEEIEDMFKRSEDDRPTQVDASGMVIKQARHAGNMKTLVDAYMKARNDSRRSNGLPEITTGELPKWARETVQNA